MRRQILVAASLACAVWAVGLAHGDGRDQRWTVSVGSVHAEPCKNADIRLELRDQAGTLVSTYDVPLKLGPLGVEVSWWDVRVPYLGKYTVTAIDRGCAEGSKTETTIPIRVTEREMPDTLILLATGDKARWRLYYFGVTRRLTGLEVLQFDEKAHRLRNVSSRSISLCRMMLGPQVRELRLLGEKWEDGEHYVYPEAVESLGPGEDLILESPRARVIRAGRDRGEASGDDPAPLLARVLEARTMPPPGTFAYISNPPDGDADSPFIGHCDVYILELFVSPDFESRLKER